MKKIFAVLATLMLSMTLAGCGLNETQEARSYSADVPSRFIVLEQGDYWYVVADQETKVMYTVSNGRYNRGSFAMLVNSDGTPLLYEGEL